jgi:hypothetical protein
VSRRRRRRRRRPGPRRDVVSCGASASASAGTLWERVGPSPAPFGVVRGGCARWGPRLAGPSQELSKLGALRGGDPHPQRTCAAGGRRTSGAPEPGCARRATPRRSPRRPLRAPVRPPAPSLSLAGEAASARVACRAFAVRRARCAPRAAFPGRATNLCGELGPETRSGVCFLCEGERGGRAVGRGAGPCSRTESPHPPPGKLRGSDAVVPLSTAEPR